MKAEREETSAEETYESSKGWFNRFKTISNFHNIKAQGEAASADTAAAEILYKMVTIHVDVDEMASIGRKCQLELLLQIKRNLCLDSKLQKIG